ncbi:MAG: hypothetical protein AAF631_08810 [Pseudomonadota bacterium]
MFRKIALSSVLAAAVAALPLGGGQARAADPHDIIGGAIALGVIGAIIAHERDKDRRVTVTRRAPDYHHRDRGTLHRHGNVTHRHVITGRHSHGHQKVAPKRQVRKSLPRTCLRQRWTRDGWQTFYKSSCLRRLGY